MVTFLDGRNEVCRRLPVVSERTGISEETLRYRMKVCKGKGIAFTYCSSGGIIVKETVLWE